jgi:hypothetical protein
MLSVKLPNLKLKTRPKQLLGSLPLVIVLPGLVNKISSFIIKKTICGVLKLIKLTPNYYDHFYPTHKRSYEVLGKPQPFVKDDLSRKERRSYTCIL